MERMLRNRDHILFGHQSPGAFSGEEVRGAPRTSADVDFSDVFGGPPMTSAAFEGLHGFSKSANASLSGAAGEEFIAAEEAAMRRWRWSTSHVENDGVGETDSPGRRRNFANESASSTPRRTNEHSTSSLSSSAVLSSADPAPPPIDRRSGGASFAAHLSDPVISIQGSDSPGIISPRANTAEKTDRNAPANARRSARTKNQPRGISRPSIYKIPPHLQLPTSLHTPPEAVILAQQLYEEEEAEEERVRLSYSASHFHFSIYKWASADTSLLLPYTSKNKSKRVSASNFQADGDSGARLMKDKKEKKFPSFSAAKFDSNNVENIPAKHSKHSGEEETKVGDKETGLEARKRKSFVYNLLGRQRDADHTAENTTTVKNNVKAFIKIFDSEGVESQPLKPRTRKDKEQPKEPGEGHVTKAVEADQRPDKVVEPVSDENVSSKRKDDHASEAEGSPVLLPDAGDMSFRDIDACFEGIDECLVEELSQSQKKVSEADLYQERIVASDAKIREWSRGKEGNIRSLLSTLQYVLWPESGWKPVPLVDIIEGGSVRRAYQKALLCLHPDKLQQKGAEKHQKYVAEKVFNILQDAWTHFSSMSSL